MTFCKRILVLTAIVSMTLVFGCGIVCSASYANAFESESIGCFEDFKNLDCELDGYEASVTFYACTLSVSGYRLAFEVKLDKDFLLNAGKVENNIHYAPTILQDLMEKFVLMGYTTEIFNGQLSAVLEFESMTDYYISNGIDGFEVSEKNNNKKSGLFYTDYYSTGKTIFKNIDSSDNIVGYIFEKLIESGADENKILLRYVYGTPYKTITSDADEVGFDTGRSIYLHSFDMTVATKDREINLTNHSPNAWAFYLLAIVIALVVVAVPLTAVIIYRKNNQEETYGG